MWLDRLGRFAAEISHRKYGKENASVSAYFLSRFSDYRAGNVTFISYNYPHKLSPFIPVVIIETPF